MKRLRFALSNPFPSSQTVQPHLEHFKEFTHAQDIKNKQNKNI